MKTKILIAVMLLAGCALAQTEAKITAADMGISTGISTGMVFTNFVLGGVGITMPTVSIVTSTTEFLIYNQVPAECPDYKPGSMFHCAVYHTKSGNTVIGKKVVTEVAEEYRIVISKGDWCTTNVSRRVLSSETKSYTREERTVEEWKPLGEGDYAWWAGQPMRLQNITNTIATGSNALVFGSNNVATLTPSTNPVWSAKETK